VLATSQRLLSPRAWHLHRGARSGAETTLRLALNGSAVEELVSFPGEMTWGWEKSCEKLENRSRYASK
jgi:hypothetical protein